MTGQPSCKNAVGEVGFFTLVLGCDLSALGTEVGYRGTQLIDWSLANLYQSGPAESPQWLTTGLAP